MKISTKGRYALRMMIDIAENQKDGYVTLKELYTYIAQYDSYTFYDGYDPLRDVQVGIHSGDPKTFDTYEKLEEAINERTKAVIVVDLGGIVAD